MKNRCSKIIKFLSVLTACVVVSSSAYAQTLQFTANSDDTMTIKGSGGASLKRNAVTLYITNTFDKSVRVMSKSINADGSFEFLWLPEKSGEYIVEARVGNLLLTETYWYSSQKEYTILMDKMKDGDKAVVKTVLDNEEDLYKLDIDPQTIKDFDTATLAEAYCLVRDYTKDKENFLLHIETAKPLASFFDETTELNFKNVKSMLEELGENIENYQFFTDIDEDNLKEEILSQYIKVLKNGLAEAGESFTDTIVLTAVKECRLWSELDKYLELLGLDVYDDSEYKDEAAREIAGKGFDSINTLKSEISDAIESAEDEAEDKKSSGSSGGSSGGGARPVSVPAPIKSEDVQVDTSPKVVFTDVTEEHWAFDAINYLRWEGVVTGSDFNCFYPDNNITRSEMVAMLTRAFNISGGESNFSDIDTSMWYYAPISAAFSKGLVSGDGDTFRPNDNITRQDMAVMIYRFSINAGREYTGEIIEFDDSFDISEYAREAVRILAGAGIINGMDENNFAPRANATRAQAAQLIYNLSTSLNR